MVVEELLELLIGEVDAKLLKTVDLEDFKTRNIEDTNEGSSLLSGELFVDLLHNEKEESVVQSLAKSFARVSSLLRVEVCLDSFVTSVDSWLAETKFEFASINTKNLGSALEGILVLNGRSFTKGRNELQVA